MNQIDRAREHLQKAAHFYSVASEDVHARAELERAALGYAVEVGRVGVKALGALGRVLGGVLENALKPPKEGT